MKIKLLNTFLPPISGIASVLGILIAFNFVVHQGNAFDSPDNGFFTLFVPIATIIALTIQFTLTLPFWKKYKLKKKVWGLTLFQFTTLLCIISGLTFGLVFWETNYGITELIVVSLTGIVAFSVYWLINLLTLRQLERL